jgi:ferritin-like metal-binding protein YciE
MSMKEEGRNEPFQSDPEALRRQFMDLLGTLHSAEKQLTDALPLMAKGAKSGDLKELFKIHDQETQGHLKTIETIARGLGAELPHKTCQFTGTMIKECAAIMVTERGSSVHDLALIAAARKIEHYEIASYGTLCAWAEKLGYTREQALLKSILGEEKLADELLTRVAWQGVPPAKIIQRASLKKIKPVRLPKNTRRFQIGE